MCTEYGTIAELTENAGKILGYVDKFSKFKRNTFKPRRTNKKWLMSRSKCARCGKIGHWARECTNEPDERGKRRQAGLHAFVVTGATPTHLLAGAVPPWQKSSPGASSSTSTRTDYSSITFEKALVEETQPSGRDTTASAFSLRALLLLFTTYDYYYRH